MKNYLKKLKLIDTFSTEIEISRDEFVEKLTAIVDKGSIGLFSDPFEMLTSGKNEYKGQVNFEGFEIRKRRRFFDTSSSLSRAEGTFSEQNNKLRIDTEVNSLGGFTTFILAFLVIFYLGIVITIMGSDDEASFIVIPFILIHGSLMLSIPYFMIKRSVQKLKYDLEREFVFITKK